MEDLKEYICDHLCGKLNGCLSQEEADEICERCQLDEEVERAVGTAYHLGFIEGLKKASEIAENTILKPDIE